MSTEAGALRSIEDALADEAVREASRPRRTQ